MKPREEEKPKNIYDYNTFIPNRYLIPLYNSVEELINKNKEQEKIIELMAKEINDGMFFNSAEEVKEYFKKKAKGE